MGTDPVIDGARLILIWLGRQRQPSFDRRECHRALDHRFPTTAELDPALTVLIEHGFIRLRSCSFT